MLEPPRAIMLVSVRGLCADVNAAKHAGLVDLFARHTFVGCASARHALVQHDTSLYLMDVAHLSERLMQQLVLAGFGTFAKIVLEPARSLVELVTLGLADPESNWSQATGASASEVAETVRDLLVSRREMLAEYFAIGISADGKLCTLPVLLARYVPPLWALPLFCLQLGTLVDYSSERECFASLIRVLGSFYAVHAQQALSDLTVPGSDMTLSWAIEHCIFPALRSVFIPSGELMTSGAVLQVATLEKLYKVFERC